MWGNGGEEEHQGNIEKYGVFPWLFCDDLFVPLWAFPARPGRAGAPDSDGYPLSLGLLADVDSQQAKAGEACPVSPFCDVRVGLLFRVAARLRLSVALQVTVR